MKADFEFHRKIVDLTGNVLMQNLTEVLHRTILAGMVHTTQQPRDERVRQDHDPIVHAIRDGNAEEAEAAMKWHLEWHIRCLRFGIRDANVSYADLQLMEDLHRLAQETEKSY